MGKLWNVGVNQAADAVVMTEDGFVLLIKRGDNGQWAFPGGFADNLDTNTEETAKREALEEASIALPLDDAALIFSGKVDDARNEDDRWVETAAYLFWIPERVDIKAGDDAIDAMWVPVQKAPHIIQQNHLNILNAFFALMD